MSVKRIDKVYRPLQLVKSMEEFGSVAASQLYDADAAEYLPDFTLVPLALKPHVSVHDADGIIPDGECTSQLTNIVWTEITSGGTATVISASNVNYEIILSGAAAGMLLVKKNLAANTQITLRFEADYVDSRTSQIHHITIEKAVTCSNATTAVPVLDIDCADTVVYNPFRDADTLVITARLMKGTQQLTTNVTYVWEKKRSDNSWSALGTDVHHDLGYSLNAAGNQLTQSLRLMGGRMDVRVRATYPSQPSLTASSPTKYFTLIRRLPKYEYEYAQAEDIEANVDVIYPRLMVDDHHGIVTHPVANGNKLGELRATWLTAPGVASGNPSWSEVAHCEEPAISTAPINANGMLLDVQLQDRGPVLPVVNSSGKFLVTSSGKKVVSR